MDIDEKLILWYLDEKRDLPWRTTQDPYKIWLSEIILQQTRVNQGLPYYNSFVKVFPTVHELAAAPLEKVLKLWQGLGYYSRARNLHKAATQVLERGGDFPDNYEDLKKLKGIGDYTAAAIASFCFNEKVPVVDGNVYRVLSRLYDIHIPINSTEGQKEFKKIAQSIISSSDPATHNQAIMEFGALQCVPKNPDCPNCPFKNTCKAYYKKTVHSVPVKLKKTKVVNLYHHYLVFLTPHGKSLLYQRPKKGIWAGLYEFPLIEAQGSLLASELVEKDHFKELVGELRFRESVYNQQPITHKLSHRKIHAYFWIIELEKDIENAIDITTMRSKPVHVLMERFINQFWPEK